MTSVIYALADSGVADCCKIGKDANWPRRFRQAQSHTPRGIWVLALWEVDHTELGRAEKRATQRMLRI